MSKWVSVLAIEDDEIVRMALKRGLKLYGFRTYLAENGADGLKLAKQKKPDFILLDWMMPEMDGLEVLSELKHNKRTEHIPVFMLTGRGMMCDLDQAFEIGANDYIIKPFDLTKLGKIVKLKWQNHKSQSNVR